MFNEELLEKMRPVSPEEQALLSGAGIQRDLYMDTKSDIVKAQKLLDSGQLITIRPHTRFTHFPEHRHNYVELVYMCCGSTTHIVNGETICLREGELLFLGQGARQEILPAGEQDIAVNFIILPQFFDKVLDMIDEDESPLRRFIIDALREDCANYLLFQVSDVLPIRNLMENLIWTLMNEPANRRSINQATMGLLFLQLLNHTDRLIYRHNEDIMIIKALKYIEENYRTATLTEFSETLHYDLYLISREIKRRTGKNFKELLQKKRLSQAAYYLIHTDLLVDEIGDAVGYSNMSYFYRIFQKQYGMTPRNYRLSRRIIGDVREIYHDFDTMTKTAACCKI